MPRVEVQEANGTYYRCDGDMSIIAVWLPWVLKKVNPAPNYEAQIRFYPMLDDQNRPDWPISRDILKELDHE